MKVPISPQLVIPANPDPGYFCQAVRSGVGLGPQYEIEMDMAHAAQMLIGAASVVTPEDAVVAASPGNPKYSLQPRVDWSPDAEQAYDAMLHAGEVDCGVPQSPQSLGTT